MIIECNGSLGGTVSSISFTHCLVHDMYQ